MGVLFRHGLLSSREQEWIQSAIDKYPHAILLTGILNHDWENANLSLHPHFGEDCMGNDFEFTTGTHMYSTGQCAFGRLYFFQEKSDYNKVCEQLPDMVVDAHPFITFLPTSIINLRSLIRD